MKNKLPATIISVILMLMLAACSDSHTAELSEFRSGMESFFDRYEAYNRALSSIDPDAPASSAQLTASIDKMLADAEELTGTAVPEEFSAVTVPIDDYAGHLRTAADALHRAFDGETFDPMAYSEALPELEAAGSAIRDIIAVLRSPAE